MTLVLVFRFSIFYRTGSTIHEFHARSNVPWNLFHRLARLYLGIANSNSCVGYQIIRGGTAQELHFLRNSRDWEFALNGICSAAEHGLYEAVQIHNVSAMPTLPIVDNNWLYLFLA